MTASTSTVGFRPILSWALHFDLNGLSLSFFFVGAKMKSALPAKSSAELHSLKLRPEASRRRLGRSPGGLGRVIPFLLHTGHNAKGTLFMVLTLITLTYSGPSCTSRYVQHTSVWLGKEDQDCNS
jgi:hypothetical protein